ncbi:ferrodoxin-NADP(+) reductase [Coprinopsis cinerea AmutBmut pab1-1]|nr:ferrodoxin-NADP(+) reductase [Coprinopsis cinerea AmutBmut pab1-1]
MRPLKLAIVGGGPSAFYVAGRLLKLQSSPSVRVHLFDRLWSPHGLVRYGVAPDHPEVKNCTHKFDETAEDPRFRFFGNVNVGDSVSPVHSALNLPLSSIYKNYSHVVFATGCTLPTLHSALPPSSHSIPALSMVHWYTQHPNAPKTPPPLDKLTHVSLIGNGNVSLDVARMLLTNVDVLKKYDVPQHVLDVLAESRVEHVSIFGRRGPLEAAFTMKELRELINLPEASMVPIDTSILQAPEGTPLSRQQSRVLQLLSKGSKNRFGETKKTWSLDFFRSPTGLEIHPSQNGRPRATLSLAHTQVDPSTKRAVETGESSQVTTDLVISSLGFHGEPTASFYDPGLRHLRTLSNRVVNTTGQILKNVYASGWAATGAKGVLASTMMNAYDVAETILNDHLNEAPPDATYETVLNPKPDLEAIPPEVKEGIEKKHVVQYSDWKKVDEEEQRRGEVLGKERERMSWNEAKLLIHSP